MNNMYRVRFRASFAWSELSENEKENIVKLENRSVFSEKPVLSNAVFYEKDDEKLWFEQKLNFVPQIGLEIPDAFTELVWLDTSDTPRVATIQYFCQQDYFMIDLDWGWNNQLGMLERIERLIRRLLGEQE